MCSPLLILFIWLHVLILTNWLEASSFISTAGCLWHRTMIFKDILTLCYHRAVACDKLFSERKSRSQDLNAKWANYDWKAIDFWLTQRLELEKLSIDIPTSTCIHVYFYLHVCAKNSIVVLMSLIAVHHFKVHCASFLPIQ